MAAKISCWPQCCGPLAHRSEIKILDVDSYSQGLALFSVPNNDCGGWGEGKMGSRHGGEGGGVGGYGGVALDDVFQE